MHKTFSSCFRRLLGLFKAFILLDRLDTLTEVHHTSCLVSVSLLCVAFISTACFRHTASNHSLTSLTRSLIIRSEIGTIKGIYRHTENGARHSPPADHTHNAKQRCSVWSTFTDECDARCLTTECMVLWMRRNQVKGIYTVTTGSSPSSCLKYSVVNDVVNPGVSVIMTIITHRLFDIHKGDRCSIHCVHFAIYLLHHCVMRAVDFFCFFWIYHVISLTQHQRWFF